MAQRAKMTTKRRKAQMAMTLWHVLFACLAACPAGTQDSMPTRVWLRVWPTEQRAFTPEEIEYLLQTDLDCDDSFRLAKYAIPDSKADVANSWLCLGLLADVDATITALPSSLAAKREVYTAVTPKMQQVQADADATAMDSSWYNSFHDAAKLSDAIDTLGRSNITSPIPSIATTAEGRTVKGLFIRGPGATPESPMVIVTSGQHAREVAAVSGIFYALNQLVNGRRSEELDHQLNAVQIAVFPLMNPDGYDFAVTKDAMYRTNRNLTAANAQGCNNSYYGVDLNRNWNGYESWGKRGVNKNPCSSSQTFPGEQAFDQAETRGLKQFVEAQQAAGIHVMMGVDFHSYGPLVLHPYGYCPPKTCPEHPAVAQMQALAKAMKKQARAVAKTRYVAMSSAQLYPVGGGADDWYSHVTTGSQDKQGEGLGFTVELTRGARGRNPFDMPAQDIPKAGGETLAVIQEAIAHAAAMATSSHAGCEAMEVRVLNDLERGHGVSCGDVAAATTAVVICNGQAIRTITF